jgi:hypothetical protein
VIRHLARAHAHGPCLSTPSCSSCVHLLSCTLFLAPSNDLGCPCPPADIEYLREVHRPCQTLAKHPPCLSLEPTRCGVKELGTGKHLSLRRHRQLHALSGSPPAIPTLAAMSHIRVLAISCMQERHALKQRTHLHAVIGRPQCCVKRSSNDITLLASHFWPRCHRCACQHLPG